MERIIFNGVVLDTSSLRTQYSEVTTYFANCYIHRLMIIKSLKTGKIKKAVKYIDNESREMKKDIKFGTILLSFTNSVKHFRSVNND